MKGQYMNTSISDESIVRGFITQLETQQSLTAHNADMNWSHYMTDDGHRGIVQSQCYAFAVHVIRNAIDDDGMLWALSYNLILKDFARYMWVMEKRCIESRNAYNKYTQKFVYDTFNLMAQTYASIAKLVETVITSLELQEDATK